ncbi:type II toxin-antitoxin system HicA family toxin [Enterovirga sp. GCM10030262]|uniref:type II toxin-antitoxin system HicA family toxin n=1 Tax=Enterovirga sp. GCM10030262 TaxID=3273391 RepID=UPI0036212DD0
MVEGYGKLLGRILADNGWEFLRHAKGNHEIWTNPATGRRVSVDRGTRSRKAAMRILKQAGISHKL